MPPSQSPEMLLIHEGIPDSSSPRLTAGQLLKNARLAKGVHLAVLAVKLKVPVRQLEALEADEYEAFKGGPAFLRAITLALCRQLDTDAGPVLALLPAAVSSMSVLKASVISGAGQQRISLRSSGNSHVGARSVLGLAALMLLVTAAFLWLPAPEAWWLGFSNNEKASSAEEVAVPLGQASNPESTEAPIPAASAAQSSNFSPPPSAPPRQLSRRSLHHQACRLLNPFRLSQPCLSWTPQPMHGLKCATPKASKPINS